MLIELEKITTVKETKNVSFPICFKKEDEYYMFLNLKSALNVFTSNNTRLCTIMVLGSLATPSHLRELLGNKSAEEISTEDFTAAYEQAKKNIEITFNSSAFIG